MPRFTPYLTPRRTRHAKRLALQTRPTKASVEPPDIVDMELVNNAFKTALNGFVTFDYQTVSLQSFQAGTSATGVPVLPVNASLNTGGFSESDIPLHSLQETASTAGVPDSTTLYIPSPDDLMSPGWTSNGDLSANSPVSHVSSFEDDPTLESEGSFTLDYQTVSLQTFQAGTSEPEVFIPSVNASLNTGSLSEGDNPSQPFQGASTAEASASSTLYIIPSDNTLTLGEPEDEDFNMDSPVSYAPSFEEDPALRSEFSLLSTSPHRMEDWPMSSPISEGLPADAYTSNLPHAIADTLPGHYEAERNQITDVVGNTSLTTRALSLTTLPMGPRRSPIRFPSFVSCLQGVLFVVLVVMGVALSFQRVTDSLARPTAPILTSTVASTLELGRLESLVVELAGTVQDSHLEDKQFISNILAVVLDASSRSSKLMQRVSDVNDEVNERISVAKQLFSFSRNQLLFLRSTIDQRVQDVACDFEPRLAQLAQSRGEIKEAQLYLDYLQEALLHVRRRLIASTESSLRHRIIPMGIGAAFGFKSSVSGLDLLTVLDRVDAQRTRADLSLMSEAMVVTVQDGHIRGLKDRLVQVYPYVIQCS